MQKKIKNWDKVVQKLIDGDPKYTYFGVDLKKATVSIGNRSTTPHTFIIFQQRGDTYHLLVHHNQQHIFNESIESFKMILDESDQENIRVFVKSPDYTVEYPDSSIDSDERHKLLLLQENMHFTSSIMYDSKLNTVSHIQALDDNDRLHLRNVILGYLGELNADILNVVISSDA